jgi:hypothetical protein
MTTQTHSTSTAEIIKAEKKVAIEEYRKREAFLNDGYRRNLQHLQGRLQNGELTETEMQSASRAALRSFNEARDALYADCMAICDEAIRRECCHPNAELVDQWLDSDGTAELHTVYEFECPNCGIRWIDDKATY